LEILDFKKAYVVLPILATIETKGDGPILSLSKQILVTRDSNPITISNCLLNQIELACMNYGINDLQKFTVVLKFRPIALKEEIVLQIPKIQYEIKEKHIKRNVSLMNSKYYNGSIIPLSMNLELYGAILNKMLSIYYILKFDLNPKGFFFHKDEFVLYIFVDGSKHEGILFKDKSVFAKFEDHLLEGSSFIRITDRFTIFIDNFTISHFEKLTVNSFITPSKPNAKLNTNIVTFDIETFVKDGSFVPYACGWFDGEFIKTYYLSDFVSPYVMLLEALNDLLVFNPNAKVFVHNFSNFDYMFLTKLLYENFIVKPYFKENKVISLTYQAKNNGKTKIEMLDSYLILPSALRILAKKYKVEDQKGYFPYNFVNENNLDYIGPTPDISMFNGITPEEFEGVMSYTWNFRNEVIRYLELDLKALYQVISKFSKDIFNLEKIDVTKLPTISSIAFKIIRP
jgi:hypothetical protein